MKKIAYIELDTHAEIAHDFMEISSSASQISVDFYFSKKIKNQILSLEKNIFLSSSKEILSQLHRRRYDLIIIGTAHRYFSTFKEITEQFPTAVIVHNRTFSTLSKSHLFQNIFKKDRIFRLKLLFREGLLQASSVYKNARALLVLDSHLQDDAHLFLPLFYTKKFQKKENDGFVVVIPGGVAQHRRDYFSVFETLKNCHSAGKFTFVFLGKAQGSLLEKLENLEKNLPQNITILYFRERVSAEVFNEWMRKSDVLWCPVQPETEFFGGKEMYGKTKMTGNVGDALKYGKPAIVPSTYHSSHPFLVPQEENVFAQIEQLADFSFDFDDFSKEKVGQQLEEVLLRILST